MTITGHKLVNQRGNPDLKRYERQYEVYSDSSNDTAVEVRAYFAVTNLPSYGTAFIQATDIRDNESYCTDIDCQLLPRKRANDQLPPAAAKEVFVWLVTCKYNPIGDYRLDYYFLQTTADGSAAGVSQAQLMTDNPHQWQARYRFSFSRRSIDRLQGQFQGKFEQTPTNVYSTTAFSDVPGVANIGQWTSIQNSARVQFDPPFQGTEADLIMRVRNWSVGFKAYNLNTPGIDGPIPYSFSPAVMYENYVGTINSENINHFDPEVGIGFPSSPDGTPHKWDKWTLKLESLTSNSVRINGYYLYENDWEFHYKRGLEVADGTSRGWIESFPDISRYERNTQTGADERCYVPIKVGGIETYEPVRLNGQGQPLSNASGTDCDAVWWISYITERTNDFNHFCQANKMHVLKWDQRVNESENVDPFSP